MTEIGAEPNRPGHGAEPDLAFSGWVRTRPTEIALLQKKRGLWHAFRWSELAAQVQEIAGVLAAADGSAPPCLIVSGDSDADMVGFILAARALGGVAIPVPRRLRGEKLQMKIDEARPTHVYLRNRRDVPHWVEIYPPSGAVREIFLAQVLPRRLGGWQLRPIPGATASAPETSQRLTLQRALKDRDVIWTDEGTDWPDGLLHIIDLWLNRGLVLALPETGESVTRDRTEVQPTELFLSPGRRQELRAEMEQRLPKTGSWLRAMCDHALAGQGGPGLALLRRRIRRLSGIGRVSKARTSQVALVGARP